MMLGPPPYRFRGSLSFDHDGLIFQGYDSNSEDTTEFKISKSAITELYYGYDDTFSTFQTRGLGLTWAPIRISFEPKTFDTEELETNLYIVTNFNGAFSDNQRVFEELKQWLS